MVTIIAALLCAGTQIDARAVALKCSESVFTIEAGDRQGTAFVIDSRHLITCAHVFAPGESDATLRSKNGATVEGFLCQVDLLQDIAVVATMRQLHSPPLLFSPPFEPLPAGSSIIAIGSPAGLEQSVLQGIVSATRFPSDIGLTGTDSLIQIQLPVTGGLSGSPVVDATGTVVGMIRAASTHSAEISFAVQSGTIRRLLSERGFDPASAPDALDAVIARYRAASKVPVGAWFLKGAAQPLGGAAEFLGDAAKPKKAKHRRPKHQPKHKT